MADQRYRRDNDDDDLAYGQSYSGNRGYGDQQGEQGDRGIIGDTFKKFKTKYDQRQGQRPQQDYGYGSNPSSSTVGSQQYGGSGYAGGTYNQTSQPGQPAYPGGPPQQNKKPGLGDQVLGGLFGSIQSIGQDVQKIVGGSSSHKPPQSQGYQQGYQSGIQSNLQSHPPSGSTKNRFDSTFEGPKPGNDVKWYVDGCSYMYAVSQALESARQTIWILDWWLSPELYLRRPPARNEEWRLDKVLQRAANRGVKVNIIVYKEVTQVLTLSSSHTKHALENLSPNIGVFRHPDHLPDAQTTHSSLISGLQGLNLDFAGLSKMGADSLKGLYGITDDVILYWAHHEKLCLIDGNIAFMGGLDLCYGRWDTNQHAISDAHPSDLNKIVFPGQDYNNARVSDFSEVNHPFQNKLDRTKSSRMGWSDISICLRGPCVGDLIHHFVDRWNFIYDEKYNIRKDKRYQRLPDYPSHRKDEGPGQATGRPQAGAPIIGSQPQGQQAGQFAPPPSQGSGYTQPAWQASGRPTSSSGQPTGLNVNQPLTQPLGYNQQGQQNFPPPPPGLPHGSNQSGQYDQSQHPAYNLPPASPEPGQVAGQYSAGQGSYPPPPSGAHQGPYATDQQQPGYYPPASPQPGQYSGSQHPQQYRPPPQGYGEQQPSYSVGDDAGQYAVQSQQPSYADRPYSAQGQHAPQPPVPTFTPPPSTQQPQGYAQRPVTPTGPPESQVASQQYTAYAAPHATGQHGPSEAQAPAELGALQYQPYGGQPTARGFGGDEEYSKGYGGQRGFTDQDEYNQGYEGSRGIDDESYDYERSDERAFGRKPGRSPGRLDKYKEEARRFQNEGKRVGYGSYLEQKVDGKLAQYTGGRVGRPMSSAGGMSCQLVRSCTKWSNGTNTERSIQNAYIDLIQNAKHFIYIENQFFITATGDKQKPVKNKIGQALVDRIIRASREQQPFKIIVNIPSVPAFAGDLQDDAALGTRAIMEFQYNSICRGGNSIMEEVAKAGINPMDFIRFYNLRNYDRINVTPAMQQAQQQAGIGYNDARIQYENQLGSGYGGYGENAAPTGVPGNPAPYTQGSDQQQTPGQQSFAQSYGGPPGAQSYGAQTGQQLPYGAQPGQPQSYNVPGQQQQPYGGATRGDFDYEETSRAPGLQQPYGASQFGHQAPYGTQPQQQQYGAQQGQYQFAPPPQQAYGSQQSAQGGGNQYQQAAQAAPHVRADDWDSVSSCYMLGGQDIRNVPWSGPPETELDAFVSEELYIHSKVMIVDDQTVICGSANLNDRSMLGTHDSEIALVIQDNTPVQTTMGGRPWQASRFAASLRRQLFRKHLGLLRPQDMQRPDDNFMPVGVPNTYDWNTPEDNIVSDPLSDVFQSLWNSRARTNTEVFRKAFRAVPDDTVKTWTEYKEFYEYYFAKADAQAKGKDEKQKQARVEYGHVVRNDFPGGVKQLKELLSQVKGTLVEMPLCFLQGKQVDPCNAHAVLT